MLISDPNLVFGLRVSEFQRENIRIPVQFVTLQCSQPLSGANLNVIQLAEACVENIVVASIPKA